MLIFNNWSLGPDETDRWNPNRRIFKPGTSQESYNEKQAISKNFLLFKVTKSGRYTDDLRVHAIGSDEKQARDLAIMVVFGTYDKAMTLKPNDNPSVFIGMKISNEAKTMDFNKYVCAILDKGE
jgi:hypothetical protein